jgi:hypothetical protein
VLGAPRVAARLLAIAALRDVHARLSEQAKPEPKAEPEAKSQPTEPAPKTEAKPDPGSFKIDLPEGARSVIASQLRGKKLDEDWLLRRMQADVTTANVNAALTLIREHKS